MWGYTSCGSACHEDGGNLARSWDSGIPGHSSGDQRSGALPAESVEARELGLFRASVHGAGAGAPSSHIGFVETAIRVHALKQPPLDDNP